MKNLRFEPLQEQHISAILEIERNTNTAPWSERSFRNEITNPHAIFVTAILNSRVVGYGGIWLVIDEAHVTTVAIEPDLRGQGGGKKLMIELLQKAKKAGMACSTLEVRASNEVAIKLYERLGYVVTTTRRGYYPDNKEDAKVMWLYDLQAWEPPRN